MSNLDKLISVVSEHIRTIYKDNLRNSDELEAEQEELAKNVTLENVSEMFNDILTDVGEDDKFGDDDEGEDYDATSINNEDDGWD